MFFFSPLIFIMMLFLVTGLVLLLAVVQIGAISYTFEKIDSMGVFVTGIIAVLLA